MEYNCRKQILLKSCKSQKQTYLEREARGVKSRINFQAKQRGNYNVWQLRKLMVKSRIKFQAKPRGNHEVWQLDKLMVKGRINFQAKPRGNYDVWQLDKLMGSKKSQTQNKTKTFKQRCNFKQTRDVITKFGSWIS